MTDKIRKLDNEDELIIRANAKDIDSCILLGKFYTNICLDVSINHVSFKDGYNYLSRDLALKYLKMALENKDKIPSSKLQDIYINIAEIYKKTVQENDSIFDFIKSFFYNKYDQVEHYYKLAIESGDHEIAPYLLGKYYIENQNYILAEKYLKISADFIIDNNKIVNSFSAIPINELGKCYIKLHKNELGIKYLTIAADNGLKDAQYILGELYYILQNYELSNKYMELSLKDPKNKVSSELYLMMFNSNNPSYKYAKKWLSMNNE